MPPFDLSKLTPEAIQTLINEQIAQRGLGAYLESVTYVPQGGTAPADASHVLSLTSARTGEAIVVAIKARGFYGVLADAVLAVL